MEEKSMEVHSATIPPDFQLPNFLALSKTELRRGLLLTYHLPKGNVGDREESPLHERIDESIWQHVSNMRMVSSETLNSLSK
jgi:hypothetical protein